MAPDVTRSGQTSGVRTHSKLTLTRGGCRYTRAPSERPSVAVVSAVDGLLDSAPDAPDATDRQLLYESIDPDALDGVFRSGFTGNVSFTYNGCHVVVTSENEVHVTRLADIE